MPKPRRREIAPTANTVVPGDRLAKADDLDPKVLARRSDPQQTLETLKRNPPEARDLMSIQGLPADGKDRVQLGQLISDVILNGLYNVLPSNLQPVCERLWHSEELPTGTDGEAFWNCFDQYLIDMAKVVGPVVLCCDAVNQRLFKWHNYEPRGPELFKQLGDNLGSASLVRQGGGAKMQDPALADVGDSLIAECKDLQRCLRARQAGKTTSNSDGLLLIKQTVDPYAERREGRAAPVFPAITKQWSAFENFFSTPHGQVLSSDFIDGDCTPTKLVHELIAAYHGVEVSTVPVALSRLRSKAHRARSLQRTNPPERS